MPSAATNEGGHAMQPIEAISGAAIRRFPREILVLNATGHDSKLGGFVTHQGVLNAHSWQRGGKEE